jgi:hypothetical protein
VANQPGIQEIASKFAKSNVIGSMGKITFQLDSITAQLESKDIVGGAIQEWFGRWMETNNIPFSTRNSQTFPDFVINGNEYLEVKCFNWESGGPAFDIANFGSYIESLLEDTRRLDSDYLIIAYSMINADIKIENVWWRKVWELSGPSSTNIIEVQKKRGMPYNLRPKKFYSPNVNVFANASQFLEALHAAAEKFGHPSIHDSRWLSNVEISYAQLKNKKSENLR